MSFRTTLAILITVSITIIIIQNTDDTTFTILFTKLTLSKLVVLTAVSVSAFILGILVSWPQRGKQQHANDSYTEDDNHPDRRYPDTLSDEDREYIS